MAKQADGKKTVRMAIFRAGTHTDAAGVTRTWTADDVAAIAAAYNPEQHEAPVVVGHPKTDDPAYGWVRALSVNGGTLWADAELVPEFGELLAKGFYKKRSIALYPDGTLRHLGFLGAQPPAVKGLPNAAFGDDNETYQEYETGPEFQYSPPEGRGKEGKRMKVIDWIMGKAKAEGVTLDDLSAGSAFSEEDLKKRVETEAAKKTAEALAAKEKEFAEARTADAERIKAAEAKLKDMEAETVKKELATFCEGLLREGKLTPAMMKQGLPRFLEIIAASGTPAEFGEGDGKVTQAPIEFMKTFLSGLPKSIVFREAAGGKEAIVGATAAEKVETLITQKMKDKPDLSYGTAFAEVQKEYPDLAADYAAEATTKGKGE